MAAKVNNILSQSAVFVDLARAAAHTAATQWISMSKRPGHAGTQTKIRAGGLRGKDRA